MPDFTIQLLTARWAQEALAESGVALTAPFVDLVDSLVESIEEVLLDSGPDCFRPDIDAIYEAAADLAMEVAE